MEYHQGEGNILREGSAPKLERRRKAMNPKRFVGILLVISFIMAPCISADAQETIGVIRNTAGEATVTRGDQVLPAVAGMKLIQGDAIGTGYDGTLGVILRDDSTLSIGPKSNLVIEEFLFSPAEGKLGLLARITRGTMAYLSGLIGKLAPESARFETPTATIGIRGTYFVVKVGEPDAKKGG
jgi:hypothetical protein